MKKKFLIFTILFISLFFGVNSQKVFAKTITCKYTYDDNGDNKPDDTATLEIDLEKETYKIDNARWDGKMEGWLNDTPKWIQEPSDSKISKTIGASPSKYMKEIKKNKKCPNAIFSVDITSSSSSSSFAYSFCEESFVYVGSLSNRKVDNVIYGKDIAKWEYTDDGSTVKSYIYPCKCLYYNKLLSIGNSSVKGYYDKYVEECKNNKYSNTCQDIKSNYSKKLGELRNFCSFAMTGLNHNSPCLKSCLDLKYDIIQYDINNSLNNQRNCNLSSEIIAFVYNILKWLKYIAPVLVIILGILDFVKALAAQDDDAMKKAQGRFVKRLIAAALLFLLPLIIDYILNIFNLYDSSCDVTELFK